MDEFAPLDKLVHLFCGRMQKNSCQIDFDEPQLQNRHNFLDLHFILSPLKP